MMMSQSFGFFPDTCIIRPPKESDFCRMAELSAQLGYPCTGSEIEARLNEMHDSARYVVLIADLPGRQVAGWIGAHIFRAVELNRCAQISGLVVDCEVRSRGIGKALLSATEQWARELGCGDIYVLSNVTRTRAHRFYERNGYKWSKTQQSFGKKI
jgi:GNAT superfamily N-acetyltransferase